MNRSRFSAQLRLVPIALGVLFSGAAEAVPSPGFGTCTGHCLVSGGTLTCDVQGTLGVNAIAYVVENYNIGHCIGHDICAWGQDADGVDFGCPVTDPTIVEIVIKGSTEDDTLSFLYTSGGTTYRLENLFSTSTVTGIIIGGEGDDVINGSNYGTGTAYTEELHGEDGEDTIDANAGADVVTGGDNDDTIDGGSGADTILGGAGNDTIRGGADADLIDGGSGGDDIAGGIGIDTIYGSSGSDAICGDTDDDALLHGGADTDTVYGPDAGDVVVGGTGSGDVCDDRTSYDGSCETLLGSMGRPVRCP